MSPHQTLIKVLRDFKKEHPEIIGIANPHYKQNYYLNNESLWSSENAGRLTATIFSHYSKELKNINWFKDVDKYKPFSNEEIANFKLDEEEYLKNIEEFSNFCDFSLIGNLNRSALLLLGREDLVIKESELVRKTGMIPILMCEAGALALEKGKNIDCGGYWVYMNEEFGVPNIDSLLEYIKDVDKPITAYRAFTRGDGFNAIKTMDFFKNIEEIKTLVVGIDNEIQARNTFTDLKNIIERGS
jgi:hypothetical protein